MDELFFVPVRDALSNYNVLNPQETEPAAEFIHACIRLDPAHRPSAEELLHHPWLRDDV